MSDPNRPLRPEQALYLTVGVLALVALLAGVAEAIIGRLLNGQ